MEDWDRFGDLEEMAQTDGMAITISRCLAHSNQGEQQPMPDQQPGQRNDSSQCLTGTQAPTPVLRAKLAAEAAAASGSSG